jgi:hypothetical protein
MRLDVHCFNWTLSRGIALLRWAVGLATEYYFHGPNIDNWAGLCCVHLACPSLLALLITWPVHDVLGWRSDEVHRVTSFGNSMGAMDGALA